MKHWIRTCAILLSLACLTAGRAAEVPLLSGRVVDNAEILQPVTRSMITVAIRGLEIRTTDQMAVLTVPTIGDQSVEEYATKVFETWKLGIKGKDNGVLLVIVPQDRKMRIEVGYGLEGTLTDVVSSRIIRNVVTPQFKTGNYDQGVLDGVQAIIAQLEGQADVAPDVAPAVAPNAAASNGGNWPFESLARRMPLPARIIAGVLIFGVLGLFTYTGIATPGITGWFLYLFMLPFWGLFPVIALGSKFQPMLIGIYLLGYPIAKLLAARTAWYANTAQDLRMRRGAGMGPFKLGSGRSDDGGNSGGAGSSGGGGSSGGDGFSGGGGSSGGGGASGSW